MPAEIGPESFNKKVTTKAQRHQEKTKTETL
jgi:hypothetical protein